MAFRPEYWTPAAGLIDNDDGKAGRALAHQSHQAARGTYPAYRRMGLANRKYGQPAYGQFRRTSFSPSAVTLEHPRKSANGDVGLDQKSE
jgi:hypothetical protein